MRRLAVLSLSILALLGGPARADLTGPAVVVDGDTLEVSGVPVTLYGVDAPEAGQSCETAKGRRYDCGTEAARALAVIVSGRNVACAHQGRADAGEIVGRCMLGRMDVAGRMAEMGWALAAPRGGSDYKSAEAAARKAKSGVWQGAFQPPWEWRAKQGMGAAARPPAGESLCAKGRVRRGPECLFFDTEDGKTFSLMGAVGGLAAGRECLCGTVGRHSFCKGGPPFTVTHKGRDEDCQTVK